MAKGRPTKYTPHLGQLICDKIAGSSEGLAKICKDEKLPHYTTVFRWLQDVDKKDFLFNYLRAREAQADLLSDEIIEIADTIEAGDDNTTHVSRARLRVDARKWKASKLSPKKYGEKSDSTSTPTSADNLPGNTILWGDREIPI